MENPPGFSDIAIAADRIAGYAVRTPLLFAPFLSEMLDANIYLKPECLQRTGSFKFRGAWNAVSALGKTAADGVVACSSGNHAQGLAEAARIAGIKARIVMPADAPKVKLERTRAAGAEIILYDRATGDRDAIAREILEQHGGTLIHPFNEPAVIAGQGTVGLEIANDLDAADIRADAIVVPCGGGGLTAGIALAMSELAPEAQVWTVEPVGFDDYRRSLESGSIIPCERTVGSICDALLAIAPGEIGFSINRNCGVRGLVVDDNQALFAMGLLHERIRLVSEPGGAVAVAALLTSALDVAGKTIVAVVSGGNTDIESCQIAVDAYAKEGLG